MDKPSIKPELPILFFGTLCKAPGWSLNNLKNGAFSRSHRSEISKSKLKEVIDKSRKLLEIPDDYLIGIVPGSDTGAVEMAMWSMLGPKDVEVYSWENFGRDWTIDVLEQLPLKVSKILALIMEYFLTLVIVIQIMILSLLGMVLLQVFELKMLAGLVIVEKD